MNKLLLIVLLPFSVNAMDPSWQKWISDTIRDMTPYAKQAAFELGCKALGEIDRGIRQAAYNRSYQRQLKAQEEAQQEAAQIAQQEAQKEAAKASVMSEETQTAQEFDRCLNENFSCRDLSALGIPRRCNSPARRFTLYNEAAAQARINMFKQRKTQGGTI